MYSVEEVDINEAQTIVVVHQEEAMEVPPDDMACLLDTAAEVEVEWQSPGPTLSTIQLGGHNVVQYVEDDSLVKKEGYECDKCRRVLKTKQLLTTHFTKVHGAKVANFTVTKRFACQICNKCFASKGNRDLHRTNVHAQGFNYSCNKCGKLFKALTYLKAHDLKIHEKTVGKGYLCPICQKSFSVKGNRDIHYQTVHAEGLNFPCDKCEKRFKSQKYLNAHYKVVHESKNYETSQCSICKKSFETKVLRDMHVKNVHDADPCKCEVCGRIFKCKANALAHFRKYHTPGAPALQKRRIPFLENVHYARVQSGFQCAKCGKVFSSKRRLKYHAVEVHNNRVFGCHCGKAFKNKVALKKHMRIHTKEEVSSPKVHDERYSRVADGYACSTCSAVIRSRRNMLRHIKEVHGDDVFECYCGKSFKVKQRLRRHIMYSHALARHFECDLCGRHLKSQYMLDRHISACQRKPLCPICKKIFPEEESLGIHLLNSHGAAYHCGECGGWFKSKEFAYAHASNVANDRASISSTKMSIFGQRCEGNEEMKEESVNEVPENEKIRIKEGLECVTCEKVLDSKSDLRQHLKKIHYKNVFECVCGEGETQDNKPSVCPICRKSFTKNIYLDKHLLNVHGAQYQCGDCGSRFDSKIAANRHITKFHAPGVHLRKISIRLEEGVDYAETNVGFLCLACEDLFESKLPLRHHVKKMHSKQVFECHCGKTYNSAYYFLKHMRQDHSDQTNIEVRQFLRQPLRLYCVCGESFISKTRLGAHMKFHFDENASKSIQERQFVRKEPNLLYCVCGESFVSKIRLEVHMKYHFDENASISIQEQEFVQKEPNLLYCACGESFISKARLRIHMKYHFTDGQVKLNQCGLCRQIFTFLDELNEHMIAMHLVKCEFCGQKHDARECSVVRVL